MNSKIINNYRKIFNNTTEVNKSKRLCKNFIIQLTNYCSTEPNLVQVYRILNRAKYHMQAQMEKSPESSYICTYLIYMVNTEIDIVKYKIANPELRLRIPKLLKWTDTLTALVELIYGIQDLSVNHGKGKLDEITACFEFIFQIKLGNVSEKFGDIYIRKSNKFYIDKIRENLLRKLDK